MVQQISFTLSARKRGIHLVTREVMQALPELPENGLLHLFVQHTSAGITLGENADPDVLHDLGKIFDQIVPARQLYFRHTLEGDDDMPAHAQSLLTGYEVTIPIVKGRLALGTWQGIYLCEFRTYGDSRKLIATIMS